MTSGLTTQLYKACAALPILQQVSMAAVAHALKYWHPSYTFDEFHYDSFMCMLVRHLSSKVQHLSLLQRDGSLFISTMTAPDLTPFGPYACREDPFGSKTNSNRAMRPLRTFRRQLAWEETNGNGNVRIAGQTRGTAEFRHGRT